MKSARLASWKSDLATRSALGLALSAAAVGLSGCATGTSLHASANAMTGMLWSRFAPATVEPGYDLYAQSMAESKGVKDAAARAGTAPDQAQPGSSSEVDRPGTPRDKARNDGETPTAAQASPRRTGDDRVRVTLGRPETLPVLKASEDSAGPLLASAPGGEAPADIAPPAEEVAPPQARDAVAPPPETSGESLAEIDPGDPPAASPATETEPAPEVAQAELQPQPEHSEPAAQENPEVALTKLLDDARDRLEGMATYRLKLTRTERVGNKLQPEETAHLSIRRKPKAVRLEWSEGSGKGREVIYSAAIDDRTIHVNNANTSMPIPARLSVAVDNPLIRRNSRHGIDEAGFDTIFDNMSEQAKDGSTKADAGRISYKGIQTPEGSGRACHLIQRITPAKEIWRVYLDQESLMPFVVTAHQADGALLESYRYDDLDVNPADLASADAFDPNKRWGEAKGLFSRFAAAAGTTSGQPATMTRR